MTMAATSSRWILITLLGAAGLFPATGVYVIDPANSGAHFSVKHMMVTNVKGHFSGVTGTVEFDPQKPAATKVDATVDVSTVNTEQAKRDAHLKSSDFFDVAKFPTMRFVSKRVMAAAPGKLKFLGDLTIHGITREVTMEVDGPSPEVKDAFGSMRMGASARTTISRREFGLTWNKAMETGGVVVGDEVQINLDVKLIRKI